MSTAATVRTISGVTKNCQLPMGGLSLQGDHTVPAGAKVLEPKQCENCVVVFLREKKPFEPRRVKNYGKSSSYGVFAVAEPEYSVIYVDRGERFCANCRQRMLAPVDQTDYRTELEPQLKSAHRSAHLPRYDESVLQRTQPKRRPQAAWRELLLKAFAERGTLTAEEIQDITNINGAPWYAVTCVKTCSGFKLKTVGYAPRQSKYGRPPRVYALVETIH